MNDDTFIEVDYSQAVKNKNNSCGDVFISTKTEDGRIITSIADGLGSGIKANVLATLTGTMAVNFIKNKIDIKKSAEIIIDTLPVCKERKIGYSTFTVSEIDSFGNARVIEYDNPQFIRMKNENYIEPGKKIVELKPGKYKENILNYYKFKIGFGERLIFFSDGVTQSGMGKEKTPLGWEREKLKEYLREIIISNNEISARELSKVIVNRSLYNDDNTAHDDITACVIYCRKPRKLLVITGPSVKEENDKQMAETVDKFVGQKIVCGGTTAKIIGRELKKEITVNILEISKKVPPCAHMEGVDLITEGILTLSKVAEYLESGNIPKENNAAEKIIEYLLNNDIINFIVGTKINEAHQDPKMPLDIEIRRSIIKRIIKTLEEKYLKKTILEYI